MIITNELEWYNYQNGFQNVSQLTQWILNGRKTCIDALPSYPCYVFTDTDEHNIYHYVFTVDNARALIAVSEGI